MITELLAPLGVPEGTHDPFLGMVAQEAAVGNAPAIRTLRAQIHHLAAFDTIGNPWVPTLLLQGETGTGKGLVARTVHGSGPRAAGPFIEVNCAAIPETLLEAELFGFEAGTCTDAKRAKPGLFEAAGAGTLFLDEIETLPLPLQAKLLQAIEEKRVRRLGAVLAIDLTFPTHAEHQALGYDPWTVATSWEQAITEKVWRFGGVLLPPSLLGLVAAFGMPQSVDQMPQRAVQAALAIRQLVADTTLYEPTAPCPEVRQAVHLGTIWVDVQASNPGERLLARGETLALPMRLLGHAGPGDILVSAQVGRLIAGWCELQAHEREIGGQQPSLVGAYSVVGLRHPH